MQASEDSPNAVKETCEEMFFGHVLKCASNTSQANTDLRNLDFFSAERRVRKESKTLNETLEVIGGFD